MPKTERPKTKQSFVQFPDVRILDVRMLAKVILYKKIILYKTTYAPGPASSVVERSLRKTPSEGTAVRSPPQDDFSIAINL